MRTRRRSSGRHRRRGGRRPRSLSGRQWEIPILLAGLILAIASGVVAYRVGGPYGERLEVDRRVDRVFDEATGQLKILVYDTNGNLTPDARSYMDGERVLRTEYDDNEDGVIDIWEFFRPDQTTERLDEDTDGDGRPDRRTLFDTTGAITAEISLRDYPDHLGTGADTRVSADMEDRP